MSNNSNLFFNKVSGSDVDTATDPVNSPISLDILANIFPSTSGEDLRAWVRILTEVNEFDSLSELKSLSEEDWSKLALPPVALAQLKTFLAAKYSSNSESSRLSVELETAISDPILNEPALISQIDCVVIDISGSMASKSSLDVDKTREDVSKMLFHTLMDKLISLELSHAVGLLAFGEKITRIPVTTEYERFHDELGRLNANEGSTMLYDAIYYAADHIEEYATANMSLLDRTCVKRIFVLTDGEDNSSRFAPWQVAQSLQQKNIVLDAIPLAGGSQKVLRSICEASSGIFCQAQDQEQAIRLFEREATLHISYREERPVPPVITDASVLRSLEGDESSAPVAVDINRAVPKTVFAPALTAANAVAAASVIESSSNSSSSLKRIMREYRELVANPIPGWSAYMSADNSYSWKAFLTGMGAPYENGSWLVTIDFPSSYPFRPPNFRFLTPIYHCNISNDGILCLDVLKDCWNPSLNVSAIFEHIKTLLLNPNAMDPLDAFKGQLYRDNVELYTKEAIRWTQEKASDPIEVLAARYNVEL